MSTAPLLRQFIEDLDTVAGSRVYWSKVPDVIESPYIWLAVRGVENWGGLGSDGQGAKPYREFLDVECVDPDPGVAEGMREAIRAELHNHPAGAFGGGSIAGAMTIDHLDDYVPRNPAADSGAAVAALDATIYPGA